MQVLLNIRFLFLFFFQKNSSKNVIFLSIAQLQFIIKMHLLQLHSEQDE